ncbi:MAG: ATP-binding protein [Planctomycetaceae bacterium]
MAVLFITQPHGGTAADAFHLQRPDGWRVATTCRFEPARAGGLLHAVERLCADFPETPAVVVALGPAAELIEELRRAAATGRRITALPAPWEDRSMRLVGLTRRAALSILRIDGLQASHLSVTAANDQDALPPLLDDLLDEADRFALWDERERMRVRVALDEALVNALIHGNLEIGSELRERCDQTLERLIRRRTRQSPYDQRRLHVTARFNPAEALFVVRDEGPGFNPAALPDPTVDANLGRASGRVILMMKTYMDAVRYSASGNEVTLLKRRGSSGDDRKVSA